MAVQAVIDPAERGHLLGDIPALLIVAVVLAALTPTGTDVETAGVVTGSDEGFPAS